MAIFKRPAVKKAVGKALFKAAAKKKIGPAVKEAVKKKFPPKVGY